MEELFCPDNAGIIDFKKFLAVIGDEDFNIITECSAEGTDYIGYGPGHADFTPQSFWTSSIPRRMGSFTAICSITGVPLNVGIPVE